MSFFQVIFVLGIISIERRMPKIGSFIAIFSIGPMIDFFLFLNFIPNFSGSLLAWFQFIVGMVVACFGSSIAIITELGSGAKTQCIVTISKRFSFSIRLTKIGVELLGLIIVFLADGPIFIGTILFAIVTGPLVQWFIKVIKIFLDRANVTLKKHKNRHRLTN
jgi:uncharacterized protein